MAGLLSIERQDEVALVTMRRPEKRNALSIELLDKTMMRAYFPTSELREEKFHGLTKSLIAVR